MTDDEMDIFIEKTRMVEYYEAKYVKDGKQWARLENNDIKNLREGDIIIIYFYPLSQKYLYTLYPKIGTICTNTEYINEMMIDTCDNGIEPLFHPSVNSYSADALGYEYQIYKLF